MTNIEMKTLTIGEHTFEVVDEFARIGSLTATSKLLLVQILENAVYTSNQSENIKLLRQNIENSMATKYKIKTNLYKVMIDNAETAVVQGNAYVAALDAVGGYCIDSVTVTMGGVDITNEAYDGNGNIRISAVSGDVVITAIASQIIFVEDIVFGNVSRTDGNPTLLVQSSNARAVVIPIGRCVDKETTYRISLGQAKSNYLYGANFLHAKNTEMKFVVPESGNNAYDVIDCSTYETGAVYATGWANEDVEFTVPTDNVILTVNFRRNDYGTLTENDLANLKNSFTIEVV